MAQGINDIKRRIKSVKNTKQITKAMELVATAKLKKARNKLDASRPYYENILSSINKILLNAQGVKHPLLEERAVNNSLYIVISADRGLAGGYNSNVFKEAESAIKNKSSSKVLVLGNKGREYFTRKGYEIVESYTGIEYPSLEMSEEIVRISTEMFNRDEVDEIYIVFTQLKSTIVFEPVCRKLLPASFELSKETGKNDEKIIFRYEPSAESVLNYLIPKYLNDVIYGAWIESVASEQGSRRIAMENATENATEMIENLQLIYNRARQASITQEITEIVVGADAL